MPNDFPNILLGTAMWGWTIAKDAAFGLLDEWYGQGFREVDTATNYPINKNHQDFRRAEKILIEWINAHGITDLEIIMKVGSLNNFRTPEHLLTKSFLLMMADEYGWLFGKNLRTLMVHWDNRDDKDAIRESFEALDTARKKGLQVGISGVKNPGIYADLNREFQIDFSIQIKHNILHSDYERYGLFRGKRRFIAYGINAGGLKLENESYKPDSTFIVRGGEPSLLHSTITKVKEVMDGANQKTERRHLTNFHQIGMIYAFYQQDMQGILLGPSSVEQLQSSMEFYKYLRITDYTDVYQALL